MDRIAETRGQAETGLVPARVWDLPTRVFHWSLAATVSCSVISAKIGGNAMVWHFRFGYVVFALLLFRLVWGLVGGHWSRFARFTYAPGTVSRYLRGEHSPGDHFEVGHNPLGALSVLALLAFLAAQVGSGLVADDEIASVGPLNRFVSSAAAGRATSWHADYGSTLLLALVGLHVAAVVYYLVRKKTNLIRPMIVGDKHVPPGTPVSRDTPGLRVAALLLMSACAALVTFVVRLGG
jgi:cytochrome b